MKLTRFLHLDDYLKWCCLPLARATYCTIGLVNLYQTFEIGKYTVCGKLILPQKNRKALKKKNFGHNWLPNLHGFANICKLPVSNTFIDMQSKIL